jgi:CMP/dCMP kinase
VVKNNKNTIIIAIDGPAGSGKSTVAKELATTLQFCHLNSGALYRVTTLYIHNNFSSIEDALNDVTIEKQINEMELQIKTHDFINRYILNGDDVTDKLRSFDVDRDVSIVAANGAIRRGLMHWQRAFASNGSGIIAEGRDMGSVVFPEATYKIYLTATIEERAKRRHQQLSAKSILGHQTLEKIQNSIKERDERDSERQNSPLKCVDDAWKLDTSDMDISSVITKIISKLNI